MVKVTNDIIADLRRNAEQHDPATTVTFLGRDGHSLAVAARRLDPDFYDAHGREVVLSRALVETAVQDLEVNGGKEFPQLSDFRGAARKVDPEAVDGARQRLTEYLQTSGVPVGSADTRVVLVDTSYKGTVQELLAAAYPNTGFEGRYVFFGESPHDPHPGTKTGYASHLDADHSAGGRPRSEPPGDVRSVLSHQDAIGSIEETLHGRWTSPSRFGPNARPEQHRQRDEDAPLAGLNPVKGAEPYRDPSVRDAAKDAALVAVAHYAEHIAARRDNGIDVGAELQVGYDRCVTRMGSWIRGEAGSDPSFTRVMDSFVRRADKAHVDDLSSAIRAVGLGWEDASLVWTAYDESGPRVEQKAAFVARFRGEHGTEEDR